MRAERKKKVFAIFILLMFVGSTAAVGIGFLPSQQEQTPEQQSKNLQRIFERPLTEEEEKVYAQRDDLIIKFFYSVGCSECAKIDDSIAGLFDETGSRILLERIDIDAFEDAATMLGVKAAPSIYLKGASSELVEGPISYAELFSKVCLKYTNPPAACG